ncbi:MAG: glycosyltransferase family 39 protein [Anaerolineae bacterium]|nr:glycosyltransferase family 39 protein [Anaerolineae bacterium]
MKDWPGHKRQIEWVLLIAIIWLAFALRVICLECQSIWYDEGLSIYYAQGTLYETWSRVSQSEHPPLHPLLLHGWIRLFGDTEFSVRMLSAWWSVLAVAGMYRLGRRLFNQTAAIVAAWLMTISPFAIWFAQETRGYALALTLIVGTVDAALDLFPQTPGVRQRHPGWTHYMLYVCLAIGALYTHLYSGFVLLACNLSFLLWWIVSAGPGKRKCIARWVAAQAIVLLALCLWMPFVIAQFDANATYWHGAVYWKEIVAQTLNAFSVGKTLEGTWATGAVWSLSVLAVLGTLALCWHKRDRLTAALLWLWLLVPTMVLIVLTVNRPKFSPRYLMNALPAFLLLASSGIQWLVRLGKRQRFARADLAVWMVLLLSVTIVTGATFRSLLNYYLDKETYRPDMRSVASYIESQETDRDLIVLVGGYTLPAFTYYYDGPSPIIPMPGELLPTTEAPIEPGMLSALNEAIVGRKQLWLVLWEPYIADPTGLVTDALEQTYHRLGVGRTFHKMALMRFDVSPGPLLVESPSSVLYAKFGEQIQLVGYDLPVRAVHPGETVYVYLYWQALTEMTHDYKVFVQILDPDNGIVAQQDQIAGAAEYPTTHWKPNTTIRNRFLLTIGPETAPGQYRLITGFYNPGRKTRLAATGPSAFTDYVFVEDIEVVPSKGE